jgi:hypothetical protein
MLRRLLAIALLLTLGSLACSSNKQQQPTAEEQKKIQQEQHNAVDSAKHRIQPEEGHAEEATTTTAVSTKITAAITEIQT